MTTTTHSAAITAPFSGKLVPLSDVPDETFASGVLGEGIAIEPSDGLFCSPVDGTVETIAETKHAIGFAADNGLEILVHVGLETVSLNGEGFEILVKEGERVKAGQPVAKVDLALLRERGLKTITSIVLTGGAEDLELHGADGMAKAGKTQVLTLTAKAQPAEAAQAAPAAEETSAEKPKKKSFINFDFLQKLGKVLMTVIAVMPAAGLMISLGKLVQMGGGDIAAVMTIGTTMENIGWAVINNLHILFAVAIGGSWAKERAGGAFAAVLAFALINVITGNIFGVTSAMLADPNAVTHTLFGQEIAVNGYFTSVLGAPALNMGVFVGIIAGFVGGVAYNKYYNFRKLPDALAFFNGKRFVPMVVIAYSVVISIVLSLFWPVVQTGINNFGIWIANSSETSPVLAPFIYGTLERLLLPFGLHHRPEQRQHQRDDYRVGNDHHGHEALAVEEGQRIRQLAEVVVFIVSHTAHKTGNDAHEHAHVQGRSTQHGGKVAVDGDLLPEQSVGHGIGVCQHGAGDTEDIAGDHVDEGKCQHRGKGTAGALLCPAAADGHGE